MVYMCRYRCPYFKPFAREYAFLHVWLHVGVVCRPMGWLQSKVRGRCQVAMVVSTRLVPLWGPHAAEPDGGAGVGQLAALVGKEPIAECGYETGGGLLTSVRCEMASSSQPYLPSLRITRWRPRPCTSKGSGLVFEIHSNTLILFGYTQFTVSNDWRIEWGEVQHQLSIHDRFCGFCHIICRAEYIKYIKYIIILIINKIKYFYQCGVVPLLVDRGEEMHDAVKPTGSNWSGWGKAQIV